MIVKKENGLFSKTDRIVLRRIKRFSHGFIHTIENLDDSSTMYLTHLLSGKYSITRNCLNIKCRDI